LFRVSIVIQFTFTQLVIVSEQKNNELKT
jgi:hypothetical protein